jgi:hypothetical protein
MSERLWGILEKPNLTPTTVVQGSTFSTDISTIPLHPRIYWLLFWVAKLNQFGTHPTKPQNLRVQIENLKYFDNIENKIAITDIFEIYQ